MGSANKLFALFLTLIFVASSLLLAPLTSAQSIPKPSVPEFTVKLIDSSYTPPATSTIDPYTGETITHPSQHIEARTIEIRIKNEPFTPFEVNLGTSKWTASYQYNIRWKGQFEEDWHNLFFTADGYLSRSSESPETVFAPQGEYSSTEGLKMDRRGMYTTFPPNSKLDFQVQALIGFIHREVTPIPGGGWLFTGEVSDWSPTQSLTIPSSSSSVTPAPSSTNSQSSTTPTMPPDTISDNTTTILFSIIVATLVISVISLLLYVRHLKKNNAVKK